MGFEDLRMIVSSSALTIISAVDVPLDAQPLLTFDLTSFTNFPSLKKKVVVVPQPRACVAALTTTRHTAVRVP